MKKYLLKFHWLLSSQFGLDVLQFFRSIRAIPRFCLDWWRFTREYKGALDLMPCFQDRYAEGGSVRNEYFWQDMTVARWIFQAAPQRHIDVGSRIDGFVAHVASYREVEVLDVRPIPLAIPGIVFRQADMMQPLDAGNAGQACCDSLSCLHALEHFGLGRYGDPIHPKGYELGIANMARLLLPAGRLYLSTPVGRERVEFNANRVFDPQTIVRCAALHGLVLESFTEVHGDGIVGPHPGSDVDFSRLAAQEYRLGLFIFVKQT